MADDVTQQPTPPGRTPVGERRHPVHVFAGRLHAVLDDLAETALLSLDSAETTETVVELTTALARLRALQLAVVAHADVLDVAATVDATSTAGWLRTLLPVTGPAATKDVKLAASLAGERHEPTAAALAAGEVLAEQAPVIVTAVDALPSWVGPQDRRKAEKHLVGLAATHDAKELAVLGRRVLGVIDPDAAGEALDRRVEGEEDRKGVA